MAKDIAVFGLFPTRTDLERGVEALRTAGFRGSDISVLLPQEHGHRLTDQRALVPT